MVGGVNVTMRRWVMIRKLDGGGGGGGCGWLRERVREIEIRERNGKYSYIILMCGMVK